MPPKPPSKPSRPKPKTPERALAEEIAADLGNRWMLDSDGISFEEITKMVADRIKRHLKGRLK